MIENNVWFLGVYYKIILQFQFMLGQDLNICHLNIILVSSNIDKRNFRVICSALVSLKILEIVVKILIFSILTNVINFKHLRIVSKPI